MTNPSLQIGDGNWAYKEDNLLGYAVSPVNNKFLPREMTFTRASDGTRVNEDGLVENMPFNLLQYSEQFDNGAWIKFDASATANATTAPNGTTTADKFVEGTGSSIHRFIQGAAIVSGQSYTFSVYAKASERTRLLLRTNNGSADQDTYFDLTNGTIVSGTGTIENAGNGWYKLSRSLTATTSVSSNFICQLLLVNTGTNTSYTGDGTSGIYIWGAQLNLGSTAKPYFPTTNRQDVPRIDYSSGTGALLLEPQRTNLVQYSEQFDNAWYTNVNSSETANNTISPDGTQNADKLTEDNTNGIHIIYNNSAIATTANQTYTASVYYKKGTRRYFSIKLQIGSSSYTQVFDADGVTTGSNSSNGLTSVSTSIVSIGNGWVRATLTGTSSTTNAYCLFGLSDSASPSFDAVNYNPTYQGTGTDYGHLWGAQLEAGSYPTSYIPTKGSSVTRLADACYRTGISEYIGQTEGTLFVEFDFTNISSSQVILSAHDGATNKRLEIWANNNTINGFIGGSVNIAIGSTTIPDGIHKAAVAYDESGNQAFYVDGVQVGTSTTTYTISALTAIAFMQFGGLTKPTAGVNQTLLFKTRLTNTELAALTTL